MIKTIYQKQQAKIIEKAEKENHYEKQCHRNHWRITQQEVQNSKKNMYITKKQSSFKCTG